METINKDGFWLNEVSEDSYELRLRLSWYYTDVFHSFNLFDFDKSINDITVSSDIYHVFMIQDCELSRYKHIVQIYNDIKDQLDTNIEFIESNKNIFDFQLSKISLKCYLDDYNEYEFDDEYRTGKTTGFAITSSFDSSNQIKNPY